MTTVALEAQNPSLDLGAGFLNKIANFINSLDFTGVTKLARGMVAPFVRTAVSALTLTGALGFMYHLGLSKNLEPGADWYKSVGGWLSKGTEFSMKGSADMYSGMLSNLGPEAKRWVDSIDTWKTKDLLAPKTPPPVGGGI